MKWKKKEMNLWEVANKVAEGVNLNLKKRVKIVS